MINHIEKLSPCRTDESAIERLLKDWYALHTEAINPQPLIIPIAQTYYLDGVAQGVDITYTAFIQWQTEPVQAPPSLRPVDRIRFPRSPLNGKR